MSKLLLTYDVHDTIDHAKLKEILIANNWVDEDLSDEGYTCHLPNTTFLKKEGDAVAERDWFCNLVGADNLIRVMVFPADGWAGIVGAKHSTDIV